MKVVMVDSLIGNDYSVWLCRGLAKAGVEPVLICTENRRGMDEPFLVLPRSPAKGGKEGMIRKSFKYVCYLVWLFFYLRRCKAQIIHFQFFRRERMECLYFPLLRVLNMPLVFTAHNVVPHEARAIDSSLRSLVYRAATKIVVHTPAIRKRLQTTFALPGEKISVIPAVKPVSGFRDASITKTNARHYLKISPDAKLLLFFGNIREYKGLSLLLDAFNIAHRSDGCLRLLIAGRVQSEALLDEYRAQIQALDASDSVIFKPEFIPKKDVDYYFRAADALAVPYSRIDFSGILQEALAYGLPILATNVGNFKETIQSAGYVTNENTAEEFSKIILMAFKDPDRLAVMREAALAIDRTCPEWDEIGRLTIEVYSEIGRTSAVECSRTI
jgi:D-inositol-3-phosphate glycosyltransferase